MEEDNFIPPTTIIDPFFEQDDFLYTDNYTNLLPYYSYPSDPLLSFSPEIFPPTDFECYQCSKRQKSFNDSYYSDFILNCFDGYPLNSSNPCPAFFPELLLPTAEIPIPLVYSNGEVDSSRKSNGGSLSAQSVAARQRRRKITEKTQELGKLIPGGNKMNTAEMFQAAFKYVKYLQAQVAILELMGSLKDSKDQPSHVEELQVLLASSTIQEKLYSEDKCLVPKEFVETLVIDHNVRSNPSISKDVNSLIRSDG